MSGVTLAPLCKSQLLVHVLTLLASGGCLVWLATRFYFWFLAGIILLFIFVLIGKSSWRCLDCKHAWVAKKGMEGQSRQEIKEKEKKEKR